MTRPRTEWLAAALAAWLLAAAGSSTAQQGRQAQPAPPAPPPAVVPVPAEQPDRTASQFGEWTMRCEVSRAAGNAPARSCEMVQTLLDQRGQPVALIVVGRLTRADRWRLLVQLPLEIRVEQPARIFAEAADGDAVSLPFRSCSTSRGGCFADLELADDAVLRRFRARGDGQGRIEFHDAGGRLLQTPFGLRGFGAALDALTREG